VTVLTQRITWAIERAIRQDPRQYLWLHRRWKHQPPSLVPAAA
jgi:KDO2-lipid IV(A) lauroyltransferase